MRLAPRRLLPALAAVALAMALVVVGGIVGQPGGATEDVRVSGASAAAPGSIEALQERLARVPGDYPGWATLGTLYVDRARVTGDPTWYGKAQGAFERSLEVKPAEDNPGALTGLASLQSAQHDFAAAETTARRAIAINPFDAGAYAVLTDALTELGRYDEAADALQKMADLKPSFAALARISYARELRGDVAGARTAMEQALATAASPGDAGFALLHLGELAWAYGGDVDKAADLWAQGLRRDPTALPLQAAAARAAAAQGRTEQALAAYADVNARVPVQQNLVEHAELLASLGRDDEAQAQLETVRVANQLLEAQGSVVDLETALFEADHGTPERALAAAQEAYDARPTNVFAADALGWALHAAGRDAEALAHADAALSLGVKPASFLFHRGMILAELGRTDAATADLKAALATNPHFSILHAKTARDTLAKLGGGTR